MIPLELLHIALKIQSPIFFRTGPNILEIVDVNKYTIAQIRDIVDVSLSAELNVIYNKFAELQKAIPTNHLGGLSLSKMRQMLRFALDSTTGAKSQMISRILETSEKGLYRTIYLLVVKQ